MEVDECAVAIHLLVEVRERERVQAWNTFSLLHKTIKSHSTTLKSLPEGGGSGCVWEYEYR